MISETIGEVLGVKIFKVISVKEGRSNLNKYNKYHLLNPSVWPFVASIAAFLLVYGLLYWFYTGHIFSVFLGLFEVLVVMFFWWRDVSYESGEQTEEVSTGLKIGMALFILSEVMFFFSFFWAFFHVSLAPGFEVGGVWPPIGLSALTVDTWGVPLLNTFLLLSSGVTVTGAHHSFLSNFDKEKFIVSWDSIRLKKFFKFKSRMITFSNIAILLWSVKKKSLVHLFIGLECMILTIVLAGIFTILQAYEYIESPICISDSVYGSSFFVMTGFHGLHVIIGTIFLITCFFRILLNQFYYKNSVGLECAIWYWHFVDVVWLFLFVSIYMWGNDSYAVAKKKSIFSFFVETKVADFARPRQLGFQDSATVTMEGIVDLHHSIMAFLICIFIVVSFMMFNCVSERFYRFKRIMGQEKKRNFIFNLSGRKESYVVEASEDLFVVRMVRGLRRKVKRERTVEELIAEAILRTKVYDETIVYGDTYICIADL